jgi:hypothetical protein
MRRVLLVAVGSVALSGCGSAGAAELDSRNPAHCIAALNMAAVWNENSKTNHKPGWSEQYRAGMLFLTQKINKSAGSLEQAKEDEVAFTKTYSEDPRMPEFIFECSKALARDPNFKGELPGV